jgi:hypothetical protein
MSKNDPIDVHQALQKAARELAFYADNGYEAEYRDAIDNLEDKLQDVRRLTAAQELRITLTAFATWLLSGGYEMSPMSEVEIVDKFLQETTK